jgi:hypothetical protein
VTDNIIKPLALIAAIVPMYACGPASDRQEISVKAPATDSTVEAATITRKRSTEDASVRFITPRDGAIVSAPVHVEFAVSGMELVRAGTDAANSGHHHILIDTDLPDMNVPIPADANHLHFGDGSTSADLTLTPGEHTLQLLFADYLHIPHDAPVYSERITITVE